MQNCPTKDHRNDWNEYHKAKRLKQVLYDLLGLRWNGVIFDRRVVVQCAWDTNIVAVGKGVVNQDSFRGI